MQSSFAHILMCAHTKLLSGVFAGLFDGGFYFQISTSCLYGNKWYVIAKENDTPRKAKVPIPWFS